MKNKVLCWVVAVGMLALALGKLRAQNTSPPDATRAGPPDAAAKAVGGSSGSANPNNPTQILAYIVIGILVGAAGQSARVIVGIKKELDAASKTGAKWDDWFDSRQLVVSLLLGGVAGIAYAVSMMGNEFLLDKRFLIGGLGAGYAGADFIEGFMARALPASEQPSTGAASTGQSKPQTLGSGVAQTTLQTANPAPGAAPAGSTVVSPVPSIRKT